MLTIIISIISASIFTINKNITVIIIIIRISIIDINIITIVIIIVITINIIIIIRGEWNGPWSERSWEWDSLSERDKELLSVR